MHDDNGWPRVLSYGGEGAKPEPKKPKPADEPAPKPEEAPKDKPSGSA